MTFIDTEGVETAEYGCTVYFMQGINPELRQQGTPEEYPYLRLPKCCPRLMEHLIFLQDRSLVE